MSRYFTDKEKALVGQMALERIKDAPVLPEEIQDTAEDALHLIHWGTYASHDLGDWGKTALKVIEKHE